MTKRNADATIVKGDTIKSELWELNINVNYDYETEQDIYNCKKLIAIKERKSLIIENEIKAVLGQ